MFFLWLLIAVSLVAALTVIAILTQDVAHMHDEEFEYEERVNGQRDAIDVARCEIDPSCDQAHHTAYDMIRAHEQEHA